MYKVSGAEILWQTKDKQFLDALIEETIELRKTPEDRKKEQQQEIGKKVNKILQETNKVTVIDSISGQETTLDLSIFNQGGAQ